MIKIIFIGSFHDDPSGNKRLRRSLQSLREAYKFPPDFIAFEYAKATHEALVPKRAELAERLKTEFPKLAKSFVTQFANTLAYEGDVSQIMASPTKSVWMLDGRKQDDMQLADRDLVAAALSNKAVNLQNWLLQKISNWTTLTDSEILTAAASVYMDESKRLASLSSADAIGEEELKLSIHSSREARMCDSVKSSLVNPSGGIYGVIIVGAAHLLDVPGSLFASCGALGLPIERKWPHDQ